MVVDINIVTQWAFAYFWSFLRIGGLVVAAPVLGTRTVPIKVKVGLVLLITSAVGSTVPMAGVIDPLSGMGLVAAGREILIGLALGFIVRLVFSAIEGGAHLISLQMGLGFASMVDPGHGITVPVVSQFYTVLATLIFLGLNGHLVLIHILVDSFQVLPVGHAIPDASLYLLVVWGGWIFAGGVLMALPAIAALLMANIAFGVMSRAAPQLNIFTVGFPITMLFGFVAMFLTIPVLLPHMISLLDRATEVAQTFLH